MYSLLNTHRIKGPLDSLLEINFMSIHPRPHPRASAAPRRNTAVFPPRQGQTTIRWHRWPLAPDGSCGEGAGAPCLGLPSARGRFSVRLSKGESASTASPWLPRIQPSGHTDTPSGQGAGRGAGGRLPSTSRGGCSQVPALCTHLSTNHFPEPRGLLGRIFPLLP